MAGSLRHMRRERGERLVPHPDDPLLQWCQAVGGKRIKVSSTNALMVDDAGAFEDAEMLAHRGASDRKPARDLADRQRAVAQTLHHPASHGIAERVEDGIRRWLVPHG